MAKRIKKVNSLLEEELSKIILKNFDFPGAIVTLTHVDSAPNLISAKVYISVFPEKNSAEILRQLSKNIYNIQQKINKKLNMRPIPKIIFVQDKQIGEAGRVEELLEELKNKEK